ncbi:MAG: histidine phosphatase family protein [Pseudomonadota bacterium]
MKPSVPLYLIRHGQTDWNREQRFQGRTDIPLNALGKRQARQNGVNLGKLKSDWTDWDFVSSPLGRTRETIELLRAAMGLDADDYELNDALIEVTFGDWERHTATELKAKFPDEFEQREHDKWNFTPPNGESYDLAAKRVRFALGSFDKPTVVVTHGGVIRAARYFIEELDGNLAASTPIPQDQIYHFNGEKGSWLPS